MKKISLFLQKYGVYSLLLLSLTQFALMTPFGFGMGCFFLTFFLIEKISKKTEETKTRKNEQPLF
jgi:hypothetical protein